MSDWPFEGLKRGHYGAIYADPPWKFEVWSEKRWHSSTRSTRSTPYAVAPIDDLRLLPVQELAAHDCCLFMWATWPMLPQCLKLIAHWGFQYKTCAFSWMKASAAQVEMFREDIDVQVGLGYWTRANSEVCLLATRGKPKRINADVRQGIIEPRRQHSRKPICVYDRIERLVVGPYCELFARNTRPGWDSWGNEVGKFGEAVA